MTSGIKEKDLHLLSSSSCNDKGTAYRKSWSGADGKYPAPSPYGTKWNPYEVTVDTTKVSQRCIQFKCTRPGGGTDTRVSGIPTTVWNVFPVLNIPANEVNKCLASILNQAKGHSWNAGVFAAESRRTTNLLVTTLGKLGRSALALKRGDVATALRQLGTAPRTTKLKSKDISGRWLEISYGWKPLVSDCFEASKAFEAISAPPKIARFNASCSAKAIHNYGGFGFTDGVVKQTFIRSQRIYFEQAESLSVPRQLGLVDPLSVAWELTPWSFVVDWFFPFGTYLSNLNQIPNLTGRWMMTNQLRTLSEVEVTNGNPNSFPPCGYHGFQHLYDEVSVWPSVSRRAGYYTRSSLSGPPNVPLPNFRNLKEAYSPTRLFNAIALAHQRFR